jgi:hypothetical protein
MGSALRRSETTPRQTVGTYVAGAGPDAQLADSLQCRQGEHSWVPQGKAGQLSGCSCMNALTRLVPQGWAGEQGGHVADIA